MQVLDLGRKSYEETWALQKQLVQDRADEKIPDTLVLVEHDPVFTLGRATGDEDQSPSQIYIEKLGAVPVVSVERGGKITFHGPGQLVGYPIFKLHHHDLRMYLRDLERILMSTLTDVAGLAARPCPETLLLEPGQLQTGVWIRDRKIASIGIAVKHWVTYHGFALNLSTDLGYFQAVEPCGFQGTIMTTLEREVGKEAEAKISPKIREALITGFTSLSKRYAPVESSSDVSISQTVLE